MWPSLAADTWGLLEATGKAAGGDQREKASQERGGAGSAGWEARAAAVFLEARQIETQSVGVAAKLREQRSSWGLVCTVSEVRRELTRVSVIFCLTSSTCASKVESNVGL